ncbi:sensor histidine kinase [Peribacillus sp. SCS-37]|uniref:sensor histidine kinase n=1 Tax=Paraperibacillus esterisolvens TaxID=3115296 RepID=UPI003905F7DC
MKITTKINLLTTAWMLCILLILNFVVYFLFVQTTVNMEEDLLYQKAENLLNDVDIRQPSSAIEGRMRNYLSDYSYIRIMEPENKIKLEVTNDKLALQKVAGKYTRNKQAQTRVISAESGEEQILIVRVPFQKGNESLEIGERLLGFEARIEMLRGILIASTIAAAILSLLGGRWLANIIMRPISTMIKTMEEIETSGVPQPVFVPNRVKDELHIMAQTFNRMIRRIQESLTKQSQFVSDASHELKTPLTIIKSYANLLRRHGLDNKELTDEAITAIHSEATRIQKMTETFLELASLEKENVLEIEKVNIVSLCQETLIQLKQVYKRVITLYYDESSIMVSADELKIKQVIIIILDNAIKYSQDNIVVRLDRFEEYAKVKITDYGIGIPEEDIDNIFERFYRVDKARNRETGGSGLGLYIAKGIMKLHRGEIKIKSKEGSGTTVELYFPINIDLQG